MKKDKELDTLAIIDNYNFCDTHTYIHTQCVLHTHGYGDYMTVLAQRAKSVKRMNKNILG